MVLVASPNERGPLAAVLSVDLDDQEKGIQKRFSPPKSVFSLLLRHPKAQRQSRHGPREQPDVGPCISRRPNKQSDQNFRQISLDTFHIGCVHRVNRRISLDSGDSVCFYLRVDIGAVGQQ